MKVIIYTAIIACSIFTNQLNLFSQNFAPLGAKWHYQYWSINTNDFISFYSLSAERDTIIDQKYCTVLTLKKNNFSEIETEVIFSEQNNKVYFYEDNNFKLYFDYGSEVGDTLNLSVPENFLNFDISCSGTPDSSNLQLYRITIDSITTGFLDNSFLRVYHTSSIISEDNSYFNWQFGKVVERIGSLNGFLGFSFMQCLGGAIGHFRCYSDSLNQIQHPSQDCNYMITNINENSNNERIKFYPNPFSTQLNIQLLQTNNSKHLLKLYNSFGQLIKYEIITQSSSFNVSELKQGIYFCEVSCNNVVMKREKIVKVN